MGDLNLLPTSTHTFDPGYLTPPHPHPPNTFEMYIVYVCHLSPPGIEYIINTILFH